MAQRIIFFSGMGGDERAFQYLDLGDIQAVNIAWQDPQPNEVFHDYVLRMLGDVAIRPTDILLGLSMGGLAVQEVASVYPVKSVILISSLRSGETLQPLFTAAQNLHLLNLVQKDLLRTTIVAGAKLLKPMLQERKKVILDMLDQFSGAYYKWAMNAVLNWQGANVACPVFHVHGDKDELFPVSLAKNATIIKGGNHLMVTSKAEEVSRVVQDFIHQSA
jgi:pimeloyl-ACP methyl ester carboxylesterase